MNPWLLLIEILFLCVVGCFISTFLHELSHCIVVWACGGKVKSFKPYPQKVHDRWVNGSMSCIYITDEVDRLVSIAPLIKAITCLIYVIIFTFIFLPLVILLFPEALDIGTWIIDYIQGKVGSDGGTYKQLSKI